MWLILCEINDKSSFWAFQGLKKRELEPICLITTDDLAYGVSWEHRIGTTGAYTKIKLADHREISSQNLKGVLNRLITPSPKNLDLIFPADRAYVTQELKTFFLSWLYSLPQPIINRPSPQGLSGQWRHQSEWIFMGARAGLPTQSYRQSSRDIEGSFFDHVPPIPSGAFVIQIIIVNGTVVGDSVPESIRKGCQRIAEMSGNQLLGLTFIVDQHEKWNLVNANTHPDLEGGGDALLDALEIALKDGKGKEC